MEKWQPGRFLTAEHIDRPVPGWIYRGLGLRMVFRASPKGRRPPFWSLVHLGTGHGLCHFNLHETPAIEFATTMAECGDWEFDGLEGWRNVDPHLRDKFLAIMDAYRDAYPKVRLSTGHGDPSPEAARAIAEARA
jgi:hypothetical protein